MRVIEIKSMLISGLLIVGFALIQSALWLGTAVR
jgi:hypothetical protein